MLASLYHAHHSLNSDDLAFWLQLAAQQGGPILELGCGSGRVLLPLMEAGYVIHGLDRDEQMLAFLRQQLDSRGESTERIYQGDLASFDLEARFPLIIVPCNTYASLLAQERRAALVCSYDHLEPGGVFAVSLPNPLALAELPDESEPKIEEVFTHPESGNPVQASSAWQQVDQGVEVSWHYDHLLPDGRVERNTLKMCYGLTGFETYQDEMEAAGLHLEAAYGDFDKSAYTADSIYLLLVAKKN